MDDTRSTPRLREQTGGLLLAIDTCGPSGSVALGRLNRQPSGQPAETLAVEILGQIELEGRSYSATLVAAVGELLSRSGTQLRLLDAIVAVNGPGSFTGVRVGLAAVKGLAEAARIPVVAVSRLEVFAATAGVVSAALDAHRHEVFLRLALPGEQGGELLAGVGELALIAPPSRIALCDEAAALLLGSAWPAAELVRAAPPNAADALSLCASRAAAGQFVDLALLDGHYLRRSDAEIFGEPAAAAPERL
ncbi:MAG: tRNA (adenosine(37)-N6)-threonylcarbamoyltransferase complex dimerization subunit type 1 TsaB [Terracidiphilus sp.]